MRNIWQQSVLRMTQQNTIHHNVSTWSPLATAFNTRRRSLINLNLLKESTGLFGKPQLATFDGFYALKESAIYTTADLINEATSGNATRPLVDIFDELSDTLCKVADLAEFVRIAHPKPLFANAAEDACITINGVVEKLNTNRKLYDALHNAVQNNTSGNKHLAELFLFDFEQSGIHLDGGPRKRVVHLTDLILQTGQRFMAGASSYRRIPRDQVPANVRSFFSSSGDSLLVSGLYADSADAMAREAAYRMYLAPDNLQDLTLTHLLDARQEMAELCGFKSYADRAIKASTMETSPNVRQFLDVLTDHLHERAKGDFDAMLKMKKNETPYLNTLACWDTPYFTQKAKTKWLQVASVDFSPYFSLGGCMEGLNLLVQALYGIHFEFEEMRAGETWANDVYKLAVVHESDGLLGHIYCDFYERHEKPNQDCHFTIQAGKVLPDGSYQNPIVVVMLSLTNGHWNGPALLSPASVDNLFHEMGHALHSMMGRARYQHVSGTRCPTDLAEVPSVLMEYFASSPTVLRLFAKHFQTQEPMPEDMLQRLCAAKNVFAASEMQLQVFYSALDQRYHGPRSDPGVNTTDMLKEVQKQYYGLPYVENTAWQHRFSHLVGYGAKYYAYLISRSVAWTIWRDHFANDPLSRSAGEKLRNGILRHGGAVPPHKLLTEYLGTTITPTTLANSLAEELDCHKDSIDLIYKVSCNKK